MNTRETRQFRPCGKQDGNMAPQRWLGFTVTSGQKYERWSCNCSGKAHVNRLFVVTRRDVLPVKEHSVGFMHGRSIFGQVLQRGNR